MRFAHNRSPFVATGRDQADTLIAKRRQNCGGGVARIVAEGAGDFVRNGTCANNRSHIRVFDVDHEGGKVSNGKVFAEMPKPSITDGVRTDTAGNVWCSCGWGDPNDDGVRCYNSAGDPAKSIFRKRSPICASAGLSETVYICGSSGAVCGLYQRDQRHEALMQ